MPFDPTLPVNGSQIASAELRAQFTSLKTLIDTLTATVTSQAAQIAALNTAVSQRMVTTDALLVFAASATGLANDATAFDDPPTQGQIEALRDKLNELINRLQTF